MKKIYGFIAIFMTVFMLIFSPAQKVEAGTCNAVCLLQMGNSTVQNLGTQLKQILATLQKTIMTWLEDAKAWLDKYAQKAWSSLGLDDKTTSTTLPEPNVPNLASKGFTPGKSYKIAGSNPVEGALTNEEAAAAIKDKTVNSGTAAMTTGKIDKIAAAKQDELVLPAGAFESAQYEESKRLYIAQQEAIDVMAKALVVKSTFDDLARMGDELDALFAAIQGASVAKPEATFGEKLNSAVKDTLTFKGGFIENFQYAGTRDHVQVIKNNLYVRFLYDKLLTMKQQLLATRLKNAAARGIREMDPVADVSPIEIILPQALPTPTDKVKTAGQ